MLPQIYGKRGDRDCVFPDDDDVIIVINGGGGGGFGCDG